MDRKLLLQQIRKKESFLCVGLDTDLEKVPRHLLSEPDPVFAFNKAIIDATEPYAVAYKINTAFYESRGSLGFECLERTAAYLPPETLRIADAKRGDIGNTSAMYAKAFLQQMPFDALTVAPYMGEDSVKPFLEVPGKWVILLALTSNKGSADFQFLQSGGQTLYETVLQKSKGWGSPENMMYVVGATHPSDFTRIRALVPDHFLLVPGVGAQGGDLAEVVRYGLNREVGLLVNSSRQIIYASSGTDFALAAAKQALLVQEQMQQLMQGI